MLDVQEMPGVINASLNKLFTEPVQIAGVINAVVRAGGGGQGGGGGQPVAEQQGAQPETEDLEEAVTKNYSAVEELNTNVQNLDSTLKNVSTNLNPAQGPTPLVDLPPILDRLLEQTGTASPTAQRQFPAFGEALGAHSQFRPGGGGGGAQQPAGALRVNLPTEFFVGLVNIHTELTAQTKQFVGMNTHLAALRIGLFGTEPFKVQIDPSEEAGLAKEATLALIPNLQRTHLIQQGFGIDETIKGLATMNELLTQASERPAGTADDPLYVQALEGGLDVNIVNQKDINVKVNNAEDIGVQVNNEVAIPVNPGTVTVIVGNTPLTVSVSEIGALITALAQGNAGQGAFGGTTIGG